MPSREPIPCVLLLMGDTAGVGPELCVKAAADLPSQCSNTSNIQIVVTGDGRVLEEAQDMTGIHLHLPTVSEFKELADRNDPAIFWDVRSEDTPSIPRAEVSEPAGREVLAALTRATELASAGNIDGIVFAPLNKESMHRGGAKHYSELEFFKERFGRSDIPGEFNIIDGIWIARATSHIPIADIAKSLSSEKISRTITLLGEALEQAGIQPRLAVAALNPHSGEHGMFGDEEGRLIGPAIEKATSRHPEWRVDGPFSADTLFPRVLKGGYSGVVGMYHDQLQIATKLIGLERGVTLHPGMKVPIATPAHGTAFDIRGTGTANHQALKNALALVCDMVSR